MKKWQKWTSSQNVKISATLNQPEQLPGTAKTHKFNNTNDITACNLKVRLITAQSEKNMYNAAQVTVTTYWEQLKQ